FRPERSPHTALEQIARTWTSVKWFVNVDIQGYDDNIDHDVLIGLLRERSDDKRFVRIIQSMLKAGYLEDWKFHIPLNYVVRAIPTQRKPPEVRIWRLRNQSRVGTVPPSTSTPHWPACWARR